MKRILFFIAFVAGLTNVWAQNTIETSVSSNPVGANEVFNYQITVNSKKCPVNKPDFGDFIIENGPFSQQSFRTEIINGQFKQITQITWTYQLRAPKIGTYTIPGAVMKCNGEEIASEPIQMTVVEGAAKPSEDKNYFMRLTANKSSVYEGEPFVVTLKYYSRSRPESFEGLDLGNTVGIFREDLNPNRQSFQTDVEQINGMRYYTIVLREEICYAQRSGKVKLEPYQAILVFQGSNIFENFRKATYSNSLEVDVKEVPIGTIADYNGLVGDFKATSEINRDHVKAGEAIDIKITVEGMGNFHAIGDIKLDFPDDFNTFEPSFEQNTATTRSGIKGKVEYNFTVIPTRQGTYEIPAYSFSYFNLDKKRIEHVSTKSYSVKVDPNEDITIDPIKKTLPDEVKDIRFIASEDSDFFVQEDLIFGSWTYGTMVGSPILLSFILLFFRRKKDNLSEDELLKIQQKNAIKQAQGAFVEIRKSVDSGENAKALKGLQTILNNFFRTKFNVGLSDLSQRAIDQRLLQLNVENELRNKFNSIWNTIEMGQYAPIAHDNLVQTVNQTEEFILALDKKI